MPRRRSALLLAVPPCAAGQDYQRDVKEAGKGHGLGPPHCRVAVRTIKAMVDTIDEQSQADPDVKQTLID
eukprot:7816971-Pyramimonas_sp.AAC.1